MAWWSRVPYETRLARSVANEHSMIFFRPFDLAAVLAQVRVIYDVDPSALKPAGPLASRLASLGWTMTAIGSAVFVVVMCLMLIPIMRRRDASMEGPPREVNERAWVVYGGAAIPAIILAILFVITLGAYRATEPTDANPLTIEVIGHQWWWEVRYPSQQVLTANEIHLPVGRPVKVLLKSDDVIHSFWFPNLNGKTDAIPGTTNTAWLEASAPGTWRGTCGEYCGMQHAHMALSVVAQPDGDLDRWLVNERADSRLPQDSSVLEGEKTFLSSQCVYCHTVRGTQATGKVGPDLTHVGSRLTLASGMLPNTRGNLAGWIENPDRLKPGTKMPAVPLSGGQLQSIVAYLESLK
jgi:cytochrome c oxidase, subunit II